MKLPIPTFRIRSRHRMLAAMVRENTGRLVAAMGFMLIMAGTTSATAYLVKPVLDDIFFKQNVRMLKLMPLVVILLYFFRSAAYFGNEYLMNYVGEGIIRRLRDLLYSRIHDLPLSFFQSEKTGGLMSRITNDVNVIKAMVSSAVTGSLRDCFSIVGLTVVIFYQDWQLAVIALVVLPVAYYPVVAFGRRVRRVSTGCQECMADLNSFLHETFAGSKIVKAFGMEEYEKRRFFNMTGKLFGLEMKAVMAKSVSSPVMEFLGGIGVALVIWYGGFRVIRGVSTVGTFFSFMTAVLLLYDPVKKLSRLNNTIQQGLAATDRVFDIIERPSEIHDPDHPVDLPDTSLRVCFDHVWFGYDEHMVIQDIDLSVEPGEILALVGSSGGGKTSLVNLIPRFYDVKKGAIRVGGVDIRDMRVADLRSRIAIVTQEPILFNDTVRNNIAYGNPDATDEMIQQAARAAYAYDFIQGFDKKFDTNIGELGGRLSGGEKQRMCIARALLKDAPILILDEATSSLDTESEKVVQKALENLMKGRTTFVIAHRLSTIGYANRIVVISGGRIVERGTHEELINAKGEYCKLYELQF